jgi:DNA modification methylase
MNKTYITDVLTGLQALPDGAAQMCVTSPPYYGLRNYGVEPTYWPAVTYTPMAGLPPVTIPAQTCCLGLESDPLAFIGHLVLVFREMHRVLRKDGTLWVNLGDSYEQSHSGKNGADTEFKGKATCEYLKPKQLLGIPWKLAYALQADGWYLRQDIIWQKPNAMPDSATDRCGKSHEYLFLLSKCPKYHFDADAIKVLSQQQPGVVTAKDSFKRAASKRAQVIPGQTVGTHRPDRKDTVPDGLANRRDVWEIEEDEFAQFLAWKAAQEPQAPSVWKIATQPYAGAHFAVFPEELPRLCILAGSKVGDVVIDPFVGSGTTAAVSVPLGRQFIGIDQDARNVPQQRKRLNDAGMMFCDPQPTWEQLDPSPQTTEDRQQPIVGEAASEQGSPALTPL